MTLSNGDLRFLPWQINLSLILIEASPSNPGITATRSKLSSLSFSDFPFSIQSIALIFSPFLNFQRLHHQFFFSIATLTPKSTTDRH
ncbi:hypothetical protein BT93_C1525 [Corymbia citriodora subsp. variegata]|nr:hypothetical protein BT93_C1525 [Corymbia citriodora subsp. variegata]